MYNIYKKKKIINNQKIKNKKKISIIISINQLYYVFILNLYKMLDLNII